MYGMETSIARRYRVHAQVVLCMSRRRDSEPLLGVALYTCITCLHVETVSFALIGGVPNFGNSTALFFFCQSPSEIGRSPYSPVNTVATVPSWLLRLIPGVDSAFSNPYTVARRPPCASALRRKPLPRQLRLVVPEPPARHRGLRRRSPSAESASALPGWPGRNSPHCQQRLHVAPATAGLPLWSLAAPLWSLAAPP
jgi:hypothetical protein